MARQKFFTEEKLGSIYRECYKALNAIRHEEDDCYLFAEELVEITGYKKSQIQKALQWGRRKFEGGKINVMQWIMSSPKGYFLPRNMNDLRIYAYSIQNIATIRSLLKTQAPLFDWLQAYNPEELHAAYLKSTNYGDEEDIGMIPWAKYMSIMEEDEYFSHE